MAGARSVFSFPIGRERRCVLLVKRFNGFFSKCGTQLSLRRRIGVNSSGVLSDSESVEEIVSSVDMGAASGEENRVIGT